MALLISSIIPFTSAFLKPPACSLAAVLEKRQNFVARFHLYYRHPVRKLNPNLSEK